VKLNCANLRTLLVAGPRDDRRPTREDDLSGKNDAKHAVALRTIARGGNDIRPHTAKTLLARRSACATIAPVRPSPKQRAALDPLSGIASDDWQILCTTRSNALVIGSARNVDVLLRALIPRLGAPVSHCTGRELKLPARSGGTIIIRNVGDMTLGDQQRLMDWLGENTRWTQTIATSPVPIFPLIGRDALIDALYYRLNMLSIVLEDEGVFDEPRAGASAPPEETV
jgi:hypothetical protein